MIEIGDVDDIGKLELDRLEMKIELRTLKERVDIIESTVKKDVLTSPEFRNEQMRRIGISDRLAVNGDYQSTNARVSELTDDIERMTIKIHSERRKFEDEHPKV